MEGKYEIIIKTPRRTENGILIFIENGNMLSGLIRTERFKAKFSNGKVKGNTFIISGHIKYFLKTVDFTIEGRVEGQNLTGIYKSRFGEYEIIGIRE